MDDRLRVTALIDWVANRSDAETEDLAWALRRRCWPGGVTDRNEPGSHDWIRKSPPSNAAQLLLHCECERRRCHVCN
ncbi:MAG TPA: hypothetical protein VF752_07070 [Thermoleophilaceae bacterium]